MTVATNSGKVYLVGAGPGDVGLFTRRGAELLGRAEVVIYDGLVSRELLRFAPPTAEITPAQIPRWRPQTSSG